MTDMPERKHVVGIKISADSWDEVIGAMREITLQIHRDGPGLCTLSGGSSFSYMLIDHQNGDMTHEKYFDALDHWLEQEHAKEKVLA